RCVPAPPLPSSPLFPYTTLFRSGQAGSLQQFHRVPQAARRGGAFGLPLLTLPASLVAVFCDVGQVQEIAERTRHGIGFAVGQARSEEHTSELQSRENLVCRLLLE